MQNDLDRTKVLQEIFCKEEIYSVEDFQQYTMIQSNVNSKTNQETDNNSGNIRVTFENNGKEQEMLLNKEYTKKIYAILKIKNNDKYMEILINKSENYYPNEILKKINSKIRIRGFIKIKIGINEFPLKNYILEETNEYDKDFEKIFNIKLKNQNYNLNETGTIVGINTINNQNLIHTKIFPNNITNENNTNNNSNQNCYNNNSTNVQINQINNNQNYNNYNQNMNLNNNYNQNINLNNNYNQNMNLNNNYNQNMNLNNNYNQNNQLNSFNQSQNQFINQSFNNGYFTTPNNFNQNFNNMMNNTPMNMISMNYPMNGLSMPLNNGYNNLMNTNMNNNQNNISYENNIQNNNNNNQNNNIQNNNNNNQNKEKNIFDIKISLDNNNLFPYVGLRNVGLTCYMNSTLQCLLHIPELNNYFLNIYPNQKNKLKKISEKTETKGLLSERYSDLLFNVLRNSSDNYKTSKSISPNSFHDIIVKLNPQFKAFDANDSKDLLLFLIQAMHEELNYYGDKTLKSVPSCNQLIAQDALNFFNTVNLELNLSIFSYLFYGIFKSETKCLICNNCYYNFQYFQIISFPLYEFKEKSQFNIYNGFKKFIEIEEMRGDNQCYCQICKKLTDSDVSTKIYSTPPYLIIHLDYGKNKKYNPGKIMFGQSLDLTGFTEEICKERTYQLIAISSHIGQSGVSGHYIAYCKNIFQDNNNVDWYKFNDSSVTKVKFEDINEYSPYFLIFRKVE